LKVAPAKFIIVNQLAKPPRNGTRKGHPIARKLAIGPAGVIARFWISVPKSRARPVAEINAT
jgi:hypothetical protein